MKRKRMGKEKEGGGDVIIQKVENRVDYAF